MLPFWGEGGRSGCKVKNFKNMSGFKKGIIYAVKIYVQMCTILLHLESVSLHPRQETTTGKIQFTSIKSELKPLGSVQISNISLHPGVPERVEGRGGNDHEKGTFSIIYTTH